MTPRDEPSSEFASGTPPRSRRICVVVDANVWASGILVKHPGSDAATIVKACQTGVLITIFSGELISEIAYTLTALTGDEATSTETAVLLTAFGDVHALKHYVMGCRDAEDDHLYELALIGKADFIISRDRDVLNPPHHVAEYLRAHEIERIEPRPFVQAVLSAAANPP